MFRKRKKKPVSPENPTDFRRRPEYEACRPAEYRLYPKLEEGVILPRLEAHLTALFAGEVDDGNGDLLDSIIFAPAREAVPDLARQQYDHADTLRRLIARRRADREDFARLLDLRRQELAELEAVHAATLNKIEKSIGKER